MILSDRDLRALLPEMAFTTEDDRRPFKPNEQVQPCTIDLRLDGRFWIPRKPRLRRGIDFRNSPIGATETRRHFRERNIGLGEGITLHPGQMLLGRTYEIFTIPNGYAGKLEARSTFARLGVSIHCTGDFINPGWRGRMPLQLVNHGLVPIVLTPYLAVCQLLVVKLSTPSDKPYGASELGSKYMNDEGEPSRYWQDQGLKKLREACGRVSLPDRVATDFYKTIGPKDHDMMDRFSDFLASCKQSDISSAHDILCQFAEYDRKRERWESGVQAAWRWLPSVFFAISLGLLARTPYEIWHYVMWGATLLLAPAGVYYTFYADRPGLAFTKEEATKIVPP